MAIFGLFKSAAEKQGKKVTSGEEIEKRGLVDKILAYETDSDFYGNDTDWKKRGSSTYFCYLRESRINTPKGKGYVMSKIGAVKPGETSAISSAFRLITREYLHEYAHKASFRMREATPQEIAEIRAAVESNQARIGANPKMRQALGLKTAAPQEPKVATPSP
jgi:hypothetical protein